MIFQKEKKSEDFSEGCEKLLVVQSRYPSPTTVLLKVTIVSTHFMFNVASSLDANNNKEVEQQISIKIFWAGNPVREGFKKKLVEFSPKRGGGVRIGQFSTKKNIVLKCIIGHFQCF